MQPFRPSRRHLLAGLATGIFGWLRPAKATPAPAAEAVPSVELVPVRTYVYDAQGRLTRETHGLQPRAARPARGPVTLGSVTIYTYDV